MYAASKILKVKLTVTEVHKDGLPAENHKWGEGNTKQIHVIASGNLFGIIGNTV